MSLLDGKAVYPKDVVAIFHACFHPTQGNIINWSSKTRDDISTDKLEYIALPSGLHLVAEDVVYFSKDGHAGVCIFKRRPTNERGHRGFRLSSLGILLAKSTRPRPWRHVADLKNLVMILYSQSEDIELLDNISDDFWKPAQAFFEQRRVPPEGLGEFGNWRGWSYELDGPEKDLAVSSPTIHLPHLLRILGPSFLTLHKHVLGRQRILIYTLPPVEPACLLCQVAADLLLDLVPTTAPPSSASSSTLPNSRNTSDSFSRLPKGRCTEGINNLGIVTLNDLDRMKSEGETGRGWIACTTDAIFLDKPSHYDLVINLATSTPNKSSRPTFYVSKPVNAGDSGRRGPTHKLSVIRFSWSDVRLWTELDRILQLDSDPHEHTCCGSPGPSSSEFNKPGSNGGYITAWTDVWRVYEDVCIICASLWMGSWKANSTMSFSTADRSGNNSGKPNARNWGSVRLEGDEDFSLGGYVRTLGMGIEGRPASIDDEANRMTASGGGGGGSSSASASSGMTVPPPSQELEARREKQILTTLALLQTFHANACFQLTQLQRILDREAQIRGSSPSGIGGDVYMSPKDVLSFELGLLSGLDARYLGWLVEQYGAGTRLVLRKGWKDVLGLVFGYG